MLRVDRQPRTASVLVDEQHALPRLAGVRRTIDAALLLRTRDAPERADEDDVGISRMDDDATDASRFAQPNVFPRRARVGGEIDPITHHVSVPNRPGLARPCPDHVWP